MEIQAIQITKRVQAPISVISGMWTGLTFHFQQIAAKTMKIKSYFSERSHDRRHNVASKTDRTPHFSKMTWTNDTGNLGAGWWKLESCRDSMAANQRAQDRRLWCVELTVKCIKMKLLCAFTIALIVSILLTIAGVVIGVIVEPVRQINAGSFAFHLLVQTEFQGHLLKFWSYMFASSFLSVLIAIRARGQAQ